MAMSDKPQGLRRVIVPSVSNARSSSCSCRSGLAAGVWMYALAGYGIGRAGGPADAGCGNANRPRRSGPARSGLRLRRVGQQLRRDCCAVGDCHKTTNAGRYLFAPRSGDHDRGIGCWNLCGAQRRRHRRLLYGPGGSNRHGPLQRRSPARVGGNQPPQFRGQHRELIPPALSLLDCRSRLALPFRRPDLRDTSPSRPPVPYSTVAVPHSGAS